jgi:hypothetical protein
LFRVAGGARAEVDQDGCQITVSINFSIAPDAKKCVYSLHIKSTRKMGQSSRTYHISPLIVCSAPKKGQKMSLNEFLGDDSQQTEALLSACNF